MGSTITSGGFGSTMSRAGATTTMSSSSKKISDGTNIAIGRTNHSKHCFNK